MDGNSEFPFLFQVLLEYDQSSVLWEESPKLHRIIERGWGWLNSRFPPHVIPSCWIAAKHGHFRVVEILSVGPTGTDYLDLDFDGRTILHEVALGGQPEMLKWLLDHG